jgi:hypothetical protein
MINSKATNKKLLAFFIISSLDVLEFMRLKNSSHYKG